MYSYENNAIWRKNKWFACNKIGNSGCGPSRIVLKTTGALQRFEPRRA